MIHLQDLSYLHPNKELFLQNIGLTLGNHEKAALIGSNGSGKSTLLKIIAGMVRPSSGTIQRSSAPYYVPQHFGQYDKYTVMQALQIEDTLNALKAILNGEVTESNLSKLNDDWGIEERSQEALATWSVADVRLDQEMKELSGGQKTKVFLAGISIHHPAIVLLDEPTNHLDIGGREILYQFITVSKASLMVVSHDRKLLNLLQPVYELSKRGLVRYGGNYDFYAWQKLVENEALQEDLKSKEKAVRKAKEIERETAEKRQRLDSRGKRKQEKAGVPTIVMNTMRNNAEKSTAKLKDILGEKVAGLVKEVDGLRKELVDIEKMKLGFENTGLHRGKFLARAKDLNFGYNNRLLWHLSLTFEIVSGERIALKGSNGSGKTTLIRILLGELEPTQGEFEKSNHRSIYVDQDYSLVDHGLTVYQQAMQFNITHLQEHEVKIRLDRFLFDQNDWNKPCKVLSGGEKMRLMLCCLTIGSAAPDLLILDEPTNNLDVQNLEILTAAVNQYNGTLIVVSHDETFLQQAGISRVIDLQDFVRTDMNQV